MILDEAAENSAKFTREWPRAMFLGQRDRLLDPTALSDMLWPEYYAAAPASGSVTRWY